MGKTKTKVKERVAEKPQETEEKVETPEIPEEAKPTEEEAQEFQQTYVQRYDPEKMTEFANASAIGLYKAFYVPYYMDAEAQVEFRNGDMILTATDPCKVMAGIVKHDTIAMNNIIFGVPDYAIQRILSVKATHIRVKGMDTPQQIEIEGSIKVGTDSAKNITVVSPIIEITDAFAQNLEQLPKKFENEITLSVELKKSEFVKVIKELTGKIQTSVSAYFVAVDGTLAIVEDGTEGIVVAELKRDIGITENTVLGKYALDYLKIMADILSKISVKTIELKFTGEDRPLWIHGMDNGFFSVDLFLAPQIDEYDKDYYVALAKAVI